MSEQSEQSEQSRDQLSQASQPSKKDKLNDILGILFYICTYTNFLRKHSELHKYVMENGLEDFIIHIENEIAAKHADPIPELEKLSPSEAEMKMIIEVVQIVLKAAAHGITAITCDRPTPLGIDYIFDLIGRKYYESIVLRSMTEFQICVKNEQTGEEKLFKRTFFEQLIQDFFLEKQGVVLQQKVI